MEFRERPVSARLLTLLVLLTSAVACGGTRVPSTPSPERIPALERQLDQTPSNVDLRARLGVAYHRDEQLEKARSLLSETLEREPGHPAATLFLGLTYEDLDRPEKAQELYSRYLSREDPPLADRIQQRLSLLRRRELESSVRTALQREDSLADRPPSSTTIAVLPFLYRGDDPEYRPLGRALAAFLVTDLAQTDRLRVLERMRVQLLLQEMELAETGYVDPATAARSGHLLGARNVVQGLLEGDEQEMSAEASVVDATEPPASLEPELQGRGPAQQIFRLEQELALGIYRTLGIELSPAERERVARKPTRNLEAMIYFGRGLIAEDSANFDLAARHYRRAAEIDPGFERASERASVASDIAAAMTTTTGTLASRATSVFFPGTGREAIFQPGRVVRGTDPLVPTPMVRDPVAEVLGIDRLGTNPSEFHIIIRPGLFRP